VLLNLNEFWDRSRLHTHDARTFTGTGCLKSQNFRWELVRFSNDRQMRGASDADTIDIDTWCYENALESMS
jgi:hypothetical protein